MPTEVGARFGREPVVAAAEHARRPLLRMMEQSLREDDVRGQGKVREGSPKCYALNPGVMDAFPLLVGINHGPRDVRNGGEKRGDRNYTRRARLSPCRDGRLC